VPSVCNWIGVVKGLVRVGGLVLYDLTLAEAAEVESYNVSLHSFQRC